jgi:hypothetical protein
MEERVKREFNQKPRYTTTNVVNDNAMSEITKRAPAEATGVRERRQSSTRHARPLNYREDSDSDVDMSEYTPRAPTKRLSSSLSTGLATDPGQPKHMPTKAATRTEEADVRQNSKWKCSVCPKEFPTLMGRDRHFNNHPACLRTGKNHSISKTDRTSGREKVTCQECHRPLTLRSRQNPAQEGGNMLTKAPTGGANSSTKQQNTTAVNREKGPPRAMSL